MKTELQSHPLADLFPMMDKERQEELIKDIKQNGLLSKIILLDGKILDGRHRYKACLSAGIEPKFRSHKGDPLSFVLSANLLRRHLTESQRAMVAAKMANLGEGKPPNVTAQICAVNPISQSEAAEKLNVSRRSVQSASKILEEGSKSDIKAVERGEKTINAVLKEIKAELEKDKTGCDIPEEILEDWNRALKFKECMNAVSRIKCLVEEGRKNDDIIFRETNQSLVANLTNAFRDLKRIIPHSVCTSCQGKKRDKCTFCKGRGFISDFLYEVTVPEELKKMRTSLKK